MVPITQLDEGLAAQSRFVFKGTVEQLGAATMPSVPETEHTAIVRVDDVLQAPPALAAFNGERITVQLAPETAAHEGEQSIFFTNGWLYGESVAVVAVGHRPVAAEETMEPSTSAREALGRLHDRNMRDRIVAAHLIVTGRVSAVRRLAGPTHLSEHDPDWHEADVQVESVEKGARAEPVVTVRFPQSTDVRWHRAPKFSEGDEGVFLLQREEIEPTKVVHTALHPLDFRSREELPRIRQQIVGPP
jgi:hypothetical protein